MSWIERHWYVVLFAMFLLAPLVGCATDTSTCPPIQEYSKEDQMKAADEIGRMVDDGGYPTILRFLGDYKAERGQLRACFN